MARHGRCSPFSSHELTELYLFSSVALWPGPKHAKKEKGQEQRQGPKQRHGQGQAQGERQGQGQE